ncbi:hypothetical protein M9458_053055, partial [Cirrhinus mrigala]
AANAHDQRIEALEQLCSKLTAESAQMYVKLDDLESRSRRQNIRIVGIKEKEEQGQPTSSWERRIFKHRYGWIGRTAV